jgi:hypothetical protein
MEGEYRTLIDQIVASQKNARSINRKLAAELHVNVFVVFKDSKKYCKLVSFVKVTIRQKYQVVSSMRADILIGSKSSI